MIDLETASCHDLREEVIRLRTSLNAAWELVKTYKQENASLRAGIAEAKRTSGLPIAAREIPALTRHDTLFERLEEEAEMRGEV